MRLRTMLVAGALVALCASSDAWAQGRGRGGFGFGGRFGGNVYYTSLLRVEKIQEAINLTDEQEEKIDAAREEMAEARRAARGERGGLQDVQDMTDEDRQAFFARMREQSIARAQAEKEKVGEILDDARNQSGGGRVK